MDGLARGDMASRFDAYSKATGTAWLTPNEVRAIQHRPPVPGGDELVRQAGQSGAAAEEIPNGAGL